jgi:di/tricarboxylate transporter
MKGIFIIILACLLFPDRFDVTSVTAKRGLEPFSRNERILTVILSLTLVLWGTDSIHGISPAWIALAAGLVCMLPFVGVLQVGKSDQTINYSPFFYVAGVLGMGAVVNDTGLGDTLGRGIIGLIGFEPGHDMRNFFSLVLFATALGPITTSPGIPAVLAPLSADLAAATGFPLLTVLMTQVIAFSTVLLPYQVPPVVVGMQLGGVSMLRGTRLILALAAASIILLLPLNYLWWSFLGVFTP